MTKQNKLIKKILDDVAGAEKFALHLPHDAPRTQFILDLCVYCRHNYHVKRCSWHGSFWYSKIFINDELAEAKLNLAAGILCRLIGIQNRYRSYYKKPTPINSGGALTVSSKAGSKVVRQSVLQLVEICAQDLASYCDRYRQEFARVKAAGGAAILIPKGPGELEKVADRALRQVRDQLNASTDVSGCCGEKLLT